MVREGFLTSSMRYKRRRDGMARRTRMRAGRMVQMVSISWASRVLREENFLVSRLNTA